MWSYLIFICISSIFVHYSVSSLDLHFWMWKDRWLKALMAIADCGYKHRIKIEVLKCMEGKFTKESMEVIRTLNAHVAAYRWEILSAHKLRNTIAIFIFLFIDFEAFLLCLIDIVFMLLENIQNKQHLWLLNALASLHFYNHPQKLFKAWMFLYS